MDISIIIPFYQKHVTLERCLQSIRFSELEMEMIVVDDGSNPSLNVDIQNQYKNLVVLTTENNGPGYARNFGAKHANGKYLLFLDADDFLEERFETIMLAFIKKKVDVIVGGFKYVSKTASRLPFLSHEDQQQMFFRPKDYNIKEFRQVLDFFAAGTTLVKRDFFLQTLGYYEKNKATFGEDIFLWFQVMLKSSMIYRVNKVVVHVDDSHSQLGINRKNNRPVSVLAKCPARLFAPYCQYKSLNFVRSFLREYRKQALMRIIWEGQLKEFYWFLINYPGQVFSKRVLTYSIKRILLHVKK